MTSFVITTKVYNYNEKKKQNKVIREHNKLCIY